jgi:hypothetical protein
MPERRKRAYRQAGKKTGHRITGAPQTIEVRKLISPPKMRGSFSIAVRLLKSIAPTIRTWLVMLRAKAATS